jgi:tRNA pseudouridine13 synthase
VEQEGFRAIGDLGSRGARRTALLRISPQIKIEEKSAELEFFLPKGSYATVLLREYTKSVTVITE